MSLLTPLLAALFYGLGAYVFYWVVRLAVRHGIRDADDHRARRQA